ncbi:hypothetical protein VCHA51O444_10451 [Vibrio chagasii]|nr:hypothetical protein VCHA51O444_10451 [Vibrio chagasii]CAH7342997.1 hypothetical protein VCHA53O474_30260 [Vibrio chagasii]
MRFTGDSFGDGVGVGVGVGDGVGGWGLLDLSHPESTNNSATVIKAFCNIFLNDTILIY